ncbi:MAG: YfiR family protein [Gammaproteobacteria bacterium]
MSAFRVALRRLLGLALGGLVAVSVSPVDAQQRPYSAAEVKAAFLYRFGTYVEWPQPAAASDPIRIAVLGAPNVAMQLATYLPGRSIQGRPVQVRPIERIDDVGDAEVLFIGEDRSSTLTELIAALGKRPTLVVTDAVDGLKHGAMVNFQIVDQRVRFEISLRKAQDAGLMLSSVLLSAAIRVETSSCSRDCHGPLAPPQFALFWPFEPLEA